MEADNDKFLDFNRLKALLAEAPGPSPWYYDERSIVASENGPLKWHHLNAERCVALVDSQGIWRLLLGYYSYAMAISPSHIVVWYEGTKPAAERGIQMFLLDFSGLSPLERSRASVFQARSTPPGGVLGDKRIIFEGEPLASVTIPDSLKPGLNQFIFPVPFKTLPELLVLADNSWIRESVSISATGKRSIYCLRPDEGEVEVLPQDWFNYEERDFGYQWITKVARDRRSGRIVGTGIRLRSFVLNASGCGIDSLFD